MRLHSPRRIHDFPLAVQYIDSYTILVLYIHYGLFVGFPCPRRTLLTAATEPSIHGAHTRGYLNCLRRVMVGCEFHSFSFILRLIKSDSGVSALSPNRQQLTTSTITSNNINRYSLAQMRYTDSHEIHGTPRGNTVHRRFGVSYLNDTTVISGHNHGYIGIVHDTGRDDPDQYRMLYFKLNHSGRGEFFSASESFLVIVDPSVSHTHRRKSIHCNRSA